MNWLHYYIDSLFFCSSTAKCDGLQTAAQQEWYPSLRTNTALVWDYVKGSDHFVGISIIHTIHSSKVERSLMLSCINCPMNVSGRIRCKFVSRLGSCS